MLLTKLGELVSKDYDWSNDLAAIKAPTLLVFGDADAVRTAHAVQFSFSSSLAAEKRTAAGTDPEYPMPGSPFCPALRITTSSRRRRWHLLSLRSSTDPCRAPNEADRDLLRNDYDWSKQGCRDLGIVDADAVRTAHVLEFFGVLGGQKDAGLDGSGRPATGLAVLPCLTHYNVGSSASLATVVNPFLDAAVLGAK